LSSSGSHRQSQYSCSASSSRTLRSAQ
jgi:hypothetical protein